MDLPGYVYLARAGKAYKIGMSRNPARRVVHLWEAQPRYHAKAELIHTIATDAPRDLERRLHLIFRPWRDEGEWFELPADAVAWLCRQTAQLEEVPTFTAPRPKYNGFQLFKVKEVADMLRVDEQTMRTWIKKGLVRCFWIGRSMRIPISEVRRLGGLTNE